ncbi:MAG: signal peptide peptidase SppA [Cocleimonas sp.]|nr:signal peptide peptidase SppA [Cocleimonas sp.]
MNNDNLQMENQQAIQSLKEVALEGIKEQRAARRWKILFMLIFALIFFLMFTAIKTASSMKDTRFSMSDEYTALIEVKGVIMPDSAASAANIIPVLQEAFEDDKVKGIILQCNTPGGSPVQSSLIYDEIMRLRELHKDKPIYAVAEDLCASGGYFIVSAAEKIYANRSTLIGSIGVRMKSFGVVEVMKKIGIESREMTAGKYKALMDPFKPTTPEAEAHITKMLESTHEHFISAVKAGRGDRLKDNEDIFTGLFWTGKDAKELGVIDEFGSIESVARDVFKADTIVNFSPRKTLLDKLSQGVGTSIGSILLGEKIPQTVLY